ncbi:MAG: hypothetical protein R2791_16830 [Saprospiraceae bacterium]
MQLHFSVDVFSVMKKLISGGASFENCVSCYSQFAGSAVCPEFFAEIGTFSRLDTVESRVIAARASGSLFEGGDTAFAFCVEVAVIRDFSVIGKEVAEVGCSGHGQFTEIKYVGRQRSIAQQDDHIARPKLAVGNVLFRIASKLPENRAKSVFLLKNGT